MEEIAPRGYDDRRFNVLPTLKHGGLLREIGACDSSRTSELAPPVGFVCSDGRHLDRNYQRASPPCPGSLGQAARGAASCQTPAGLSRTEVQRLRPTLLFKQPGGRFLLEA